MRQEVALYTPRYAKAMVIISGMEHIREVTHTSGAVLAQLHYGSFFLTGCAIAQQTEFQCNAIVTHNNLLVLPDKEADFWRNTHRQVARLQRLPIFYAGQTSRQDINDYLKQPRNLLWSMLDVREVGRIRPEFPFYFQGRELYLQTGAARLATAADVPLIPVCIKYHPDEQRHRLQIGTPIYSDCSPVEMTKAALLQLSGMIGSQSAQFFHDMAYFSIPSSSNQVFS